MGAQPTAAIIEVMNRHPRILVVEDDPTVAEVVRRYLERDGFDVETVEDGISALDTVAASPPDLMILDLMLPGLDGLEVFRRARSFAPLPVIMLTARGDEHDRIVGLELGAEDRKSTRLNSSHGSISYAVFCLKQQKNNYYLFLPIIQLKYQL